MLVPSLDRAMVPGGVSGCDRVSVDPVAPLTPGGQYVFFLMPVLDSEGSMAGDLMMIGAWPSATTAQYRPRSSARFRFRKRETGSSMDPSRREAPSRPEDA